MIILIKVINDGVAVKQTNWWAAAPLKHDLVFDFDIIHRGAHEAQCFTTDHEVHLNSESIVSPL